MITKKKTDKEEIEYVPMMTRWMTLDLYPDAQLTPDGTMLVLHHDTGKLEKIKPMPPPNYDREIAKRLADLHRYEIPGLTD